MAYVVLRIKGTVNVPHWARYTLDNLSLYKKFWATILPETPESIGMLRKIKDFVAWSHVDASFVKELLEKRGKTIGSKPLKLLPDSAPYNDIDELAADLAKDKIRLSSLQMVKPWFALNPPRGGFKRKTKTQYHQKGVLGEDKELVEIIKRMI
ncbi:MAG: 50S ribosomal protein L30 [Thermoproteota archaeon]|jgi:large subunit ribosomal protein L30|nr:rpl30p [Nitrososphaeraceae archaeon]MDQ3972557.1 50S ribosomal protein L30 [Thermoproteota archaeon]